jgi:integrase
MLLRAGYGIRAVSRRLGHARPGMTLRVYSHVIPNDDAQLANGVQKMLG